MPDDVDNSFDQFDEGLRVNPLPAPEVRRRGDRLRRRNTVLVAVGGVAAAAVFVGVPVAVMAGSDQRDDVAPAPSPTAIDSTPTESPSATASPNPLLGFPLATGYPETHGTDGSPVKVTGEPGVGALQLCDQIAFDPSADTTAVIGSEYVGEAEDFRARTLALYDSPEAAAEVVTHATEVVADCPEWKSEDESGAHKEYEIQDSLSSEDQQWLIFTERYRNPQGLMGTGLTVFHLVQVGSTVFISYEYGEGGGSPETTALAIEHATEQAEAIAELMATELDPDGTSSASPVS